MYYILYIINYKCQIVKKEILNVFTIIILILIYQIIKKNSTSYDSTLEDTILDDKINKILFILIQNKKYDVANLYQISNTCEIHELQIIQSKLKNILLNINNISDKLNSIIDLYV
jgi:hypothetical protein